LHTRSSYSKVFLGLIVVSVIFVSVAANFADGFISAEVQAASLTYVRISAFSALSSALETAGSSATRALDHPDVPLLISSIKFAVNIMLDLILISRFHVRSVRPSVHTQASICLAYGMASASMGLLYFVYISSFRGFIASKRDSSGDARLERSKPSFKALKVLARRSCSFWCFNSYAWSWPIPPTCLCHQV
jgi:Na+-driven multidrug efflux pump